MFYKFFRNTFWQGLGDTFNILTGDHGILASISGYKQQYKFGLLDLTLVPLLALWMLNYGFPTKPLEGDSERIAADQSKTGVLRYFIGGIGFALQGVRALVGLCLTVMISPIVLAVHVLKYPFSKNLENQFYKLRSKDGCGTLGDMVAREQMSLNDLAVEKGNCKISVSDNLPVRSLADAYRNLNSLKFFTSAPIEDTEDDAVAAGRSLGFYS
jgi:hypothetical protein